LARADLEPGVDVSFSLYENFTARAAPHAARPAAAEWRYCDPGAALRLTFPARPGAQVMVARAVWSRGATLLAAPVLADGRVGTPVPMHAMGRLHRAELRADGAPLVGARITVRRIEPLKERQTCRAAATFVVGE
ncbi:MAG: hypothetical protein KY467_14020, partial [Gemmatimonadetes bacterium]|nr:hypothetical protein [Gemmatimonadota bacterium]